MLSAFAGTLLLVTHDRYLIEALATQIWTLEGDRLTVFAGGYRQYLAARSAQTAPTARPRKSKYTSDERAARRRRDKTRRLTAQLEQLEESIAAKEALLATLAAEIEAAGDDFERTLALSQAYAGVEARLEELIAAWEEISLQAGARDTQAR